VLPLKLSRAYNLVFWWMSIKKPTKYLLKQTWQLPQTLSADWRQLKCYFLDETFNFDSNTSMKMVIKAIISHVMWSLILFNQKEHWCVHWSCTMLQNCWDISILIAPHCMLTFISQLSFTLWGSSPLPRISVVRAMMWYQTLHIKQQTTTLKGGGHRVLSEKWKPWNFLNAQINVPTNFAT